jgi:hypothetical protein
MPLPAVVHTHLQRPGPAIRSFEIHRLLGLCWRLRCVFEESLVQGAALSILAPGFAHRIRAIASLQAGGRASRA